MAVTTWAGMIPIFILFAIGDQPGTMSLGQGCKRRALGEKKDILGFTVLKAGQKKSDLSTAWWYSFHLLVTVLFIPTCGERAGTTKQ